LRRNIAALDEHRSGRKARPYVVELQSECVKVTAPDATVTITTPEW